MAGEGNEKRAAPSPVLVAVGSAVLAACGTIAVSWILGTTSTGSTTQLALESLRGRVQALETWRNEDRTSAGIASSAIEQIRSDLRDLRTWRENTERLVQEHTKMLYDMANRGAQRDEQLANMLVILRDLKEVINRFAVDQMTLRESVLRMEQRQGSQNQRR